MQDMDMRAHPMNPNKIESYTAGVPDGLWLSWHADGSVADSMYYVAGKLHGRVVSYHPNGRLASEIAYDHGVVVTPLQIWDEEGRPLETSTTPNH